jgi:hypothetical protein
MYKEEQMREEQHRFMMLAGQLPARLTVEQTAWLLNCQTHDIPGLMAARLLKPLGNPPPNGTKFFATGDIIELTRDRAWLAKMSNAITHYWQMKNAGRRRRLPGMPGNGDAVLQPGSGANN